MTTEADPSRTKTNVSVSRRGLRGRLRARLACLAACFGVVLGAFLLPSAAQAADFEHWISGGGDPRLDIGGAEAYVTVEVKATFPPQNGQQDVTLTASLKDLDGYASVDVLDGPCVRTGAGSVTCQGMFPEEQRQVQFIIAPATESDLPQGEERRGELSIDAGGRGNGEQKTSVTVAGNAQSGTGSITGTVTHNAEPVSGADVTLNDGEGVDHETTTDGSGQFSFPANGETIAPGSMTLTVSMDGFEDTETEFEVAAGGTRNENLTLTPVQQEPEETTEEPPPSSEPASEEPSPVADEGGISGTLIVLIIIGALLVIGGIIGIVLLLRGGKDDDKDDEEGFPKDAPPEHSPTAAQVGTPGVYQAGPAPGGDSPTMVHNGPLVPDETSAYGSSAPTAFGPAYGAGNDSTQVMPQAGARPPAGPPALGPDGTQLLPTVKNTGGPGGSSGHAGPGTSDSTQVMPQANLGSPPPPAPPASAPPSAFADPGSTRPHPSPYASPTPPPSPSPGPATSSAPRSSMFEPQHSQPPGSSMFDPPSQPPQPSAPPPGSRDPYAPPPQPSQPPPPPAAPQPSPQVPPQPGTGSFGAPGTRDPYAPPPEPSAPPAEPYTPAPTQAIPQAGMSFGSSQQPSPYAPESPDQNQWPGRDEGADQTGRPDQSYRPGETDRSEEERRGWGEWDDRPRSW